MRAAALLTVALALLVLLGDRGVAVAMHGEVNRAPPCILSIENR